MWKYGFASVAGTSHVKSSSPVQDVSHAGVVCDSRGDEILIAVASDGAGSAAQAQVGSKLACDLFVDKIRAHLAGEGTVDQLADRFIASLIEEFQKLVIGKLTDGLKLQDYACTLLAAVVGVERAIYFQIGDGAIIESRREEPDRYEIVCWPQQGEYANTTNFLTDADAAGKVFCELKTGAIDEVALFTDGIQSLALDYRARSAHAPFFAPLFAWLRPRPDGYSPQLSDALAAFLNSERVNARTDDDKTLILATRK